MTRKDYVAIAAAIREQVTADANKHGHTITQQIAQRIADAMASQWGQVHEEETA